MPSDALQFSRESWDFLVRQWPMRLQLTRLVLLYMGTPGKNSKLEVTRKYSFPTLHMLGSGLKPLIIGFIYVCICVQASLSTVSIVVKDKYIV